MNPQIVKAYSLGDYETMESLIAFGSKISFFIMYVLSAPIIFNISYILKFWLGNVPEYTVEFTSLALINTLCATFSGALSISVQATGNIKRYQIIMGALLFLNFPVTYVLYKMGYPPHYSVISSTIIEIACLFERIFLSKRLYNLNIRTYLFRVFPPVFYCLICTLPILIIINIMLCKENLLLFVIRLLAGFILCCICSFYLGFTRHQRETIYAQAHRLYEKNQK